MPCVLVMKGVWVVCSGFVKVGSNFLQARRVCEEIGAQTGDEYDDLFKVVLIGDSGIGKCDPRVTSFAWSPNRRLVYSLPLAPSRYCLPCIKTLSKY